MKASDIMTPDPECVTPGESLQQAAQMMRDGDFGAIPVVDDRSGRRVVGMLTDRDIAVRYVAEGRHGPATVGDIMTQRNLAYVRPDDDVKHVLQVMQDNQVRRVPVVDQDVKLVGMIAQADLALEGPSDKKVGQTVEEISEPGGSHDQSHGGRSR